MKNIIKVGVLAILLAIVMSCRAAELNYKNCIVSVESPRSQNGFGTAGADWISTHMIEDNINFNRGIRQLPALVGITEDGFYFFFYETCPDKMKWTEYYIRNLIDTHKIDYYYRLKSLSPDEVEDLGIQEIRN